LAEIVTNSKADQVVVLGDRNMKNHSCQAKRKGKLVEMKVDELIDVMWNDWSDISPEASKIMDVDTKVEVSNLSPFNKHTEDQFYNLLEKFTGLRHVKDRLNKLEDGNELLTYSYTYSLNR
jgi:hypothetical protein